VIILGSKKIGYGIIAISVIICLLGTIGYTIEDKVEGVPTPNVPNSVFFADEPIQSNPFSLFIAANAEATWDRNDIFVVLADSDKKQQCEGMTLLEKMNQNSEVCTSRDNDFEVVGDNNVEGISWTADSGEYYLGIGTFSEVPDDFELNVDYSVELSLSATGYFASLLIAAIGLVLIKYN
tara:strand:+ start:9 stop:548 length:540 start_codon:yes stop_codon:yes gene_type:complete